MVLAVNQTGLPGVLELVPARHEDDRGFFSETFNRVVMREAGIEIDWVQENHTLSRRAGVLRGLHYQAPPRAQDKLVRVVAGAILDVVVDIRAGSPTFARHIAVELSARRWNQLLVPKGFAHGYLTLEPMTEIVYKVSDHYSKGHDCTIAYDDPAIGIDWGLADKEPVLSARDARAPGLGEQVTGFQYRA